MGCASVFVLLAIVWPLLHFLGSSYEPDVMLFPVLIGGPAFVVTRILGIIALRSKAEDTQRWGKKALWLVWGGIALFFLIGLIAFLIDLIRGKA
jgi:hypothetical protein